MQNENNENNNTYPEMIQYNNYQNDPIEEVQMEDEEIEDKDEYVNFNNNDAQNNK